MGRIRGPRAPFQSQGNADLIEALRQVNFGEEFAVEIICDGHNGVLMSRETYEDLVSPARRRQG